MAEDKDAKQLALDVAAFATSAIPYIGGPISNVLSGVGTVRRINRVREVVARLARDLQEVRSVNEEYVKSEEFKELLELALRQAADERDEQKRRLYAAFLADDIRLPGPSYDEKLRFLRTLEELQPDDLAVLRALGAPPENNPGSMGTPGQTLSRRLTGLDAAHIAELIGQLNAMRITNLGNLNIMMTGSGAADLRHAITAYGQRFLKYLNEP